MRSIAKQKLNKHFTDFSDVNFEALCRVGLNLFRRYKHKLRIESIGYLNYLPQTCKLLKDSPEYIGGGDRKDDGDHVLPC